MAISDSVPVESVKTGRFREILDFFFFKAHYIISGVYKKRFLDAG